MNDVVGVDDTAGNEERVDFLLEVLVAFEDVTEICEMRGEGRWGGREGKAGLASGRTESGEKTNRRWAVLPNERLLPVGGEVDGHDCVRCRRT
jgi:hypothetical protein